MGTAAVLWGVRQARLWQLGKLMPARLAQHMEAYGTLPVRSAFLRTRVRLQNLEALLLRTRATNVTAP